MPSAFQTTISAIPGPPSIRNASSATDSTYDRSLLTLLYDRRVRPGMTVTQARSVLPGAIADLGLATSDRGKLAPK